MKAGKGMTLADVMEQYAATTSRLKLEPAAQGFVYDALLRVASDFSRPNWYERIGADIKVRAGRARARHSLARMHVYIRTCGPLGAPRITTGSAPFSENNKNQGAEGMAGNGAA